MPSCEPASSTDSSVVLRRAARADRLRVAASSNRWRRAVNKANSMATNNALTAIKPIVTASTTHGLLIVTTSGADRDEDLGGNSPLDRTDDGGQHFWLGRPAGAVLRQRDVDAVADRGQATELCDQQPCHGLVVAVGQLLVQQSLYLVQMNVCAQQPAVGAPGDAIVGRVVFVGDLSDQFLGDV